MAVVGVVGVEVVWSTGADVAARAGIEPAVWPPASGEAPMVGVDGLVGVTLGEGASPSIRAGTTVPVLCAQPLATSAVSAEQMKIHLVVRPIIVPPCGASAATAPARTVRLVMPGTEGSQATLDGT